MFQKPISQLTEADLQILVDLSEKEGLLLEYKKEISGTDHEKKELSKDVSAMANTDGGYLIIGIEEFEGKAAKLVGTSKLIGRQPTEEWLESVLISNVRPRLTIKPRVIESTADTNKIYIIVHIPQSARRPHMVVADGKNAYYKRYNYQSNFADEHEVRSMFLESKSTGDEMKAFMDARNLTDTASPAFAVTSSLVKELLGGWGILRELPADFGGRPHVIFSACPRYLEERLDIASDDFRSWLQTNRNVELLNLSMEFLENENEISADSIQSRNIRYPNRGDKVLWRYVEIFRNGYLEQGTGPEMIWGNDKNGVMLHLTYLIAALWMFLKFAHSFYERIGYIDEVVFVVAFANIENVGMWGFGKKNATSTWREPTDFFFDEEKKRCRQKNIRIERAVLIGEMTNERTEEMVKEIAKRVSNAFGESIAKCFDDDGNFNSDGLRGFRNVH